MSYASMMNMPCIAVDWPITPNPIYGINIRFVYKPSYYYHEALLLAIMHVCSNPIAVIKDFLSMVLYYGSGT